MEHTDKQDTPTRVLLVDDDPVILDIMATGLDQAGYRVETCADAAGAVSRYGQERPDVAVLDVGLPDMPGTELARELLHAEYRPILILSNYDDREIVRQAITSGVVGYLVKPVSVAQLIPSLETSVSRHRQYARQVAAQLGDGAHAPLGEVLDRFPFALLIVDAHHHPIYRNSAARRLLAEGLLGIDPAGRLRARRHSERLIPLMDQALDRRAAPPAALLDDDPTRRLHAFAAPLGGAGEPADAPLAALVVFDSAHAARYGWDALKALYGLTRKETALVNGLLQGLSLDEYCAANFVSANTARTHLKSVYLKTGTHRQAELVRLFAAMFPPASQQEST